MKHGRLQCKDIDDAPILRKLLENPGRSHHWWDTTGWDPPICGEPMPTVRPAFPSDAPDKLARAKMASLVRRGLVSGCTCGCRGDFTITDDGMAHYFGKIAEKEKAP